MQGLASCRLLPTAPRTTTANTAPATPPPSSSLPQTSEVQKQVKAVQAAFQHGKGKKNETTPEDGKLTIDTMKVGCVCRGRWLGNGQAKFPLPP